MRLNSKLKRHSSLQKQRISCFPRVRESRQGSLRWESLSQVQEGDHLERHQPNVRSHLLVRRRVQESHLHQRNNHHRNKKVQKSQLQEALLQRRKKRPSQLLLQGLRLVPNLRWDQNLISAPSHLLADRRQKQLQRPSQLSWRRWP